MIYAAQHAQQGISSDFINNVIENLEDMTTNSENLLDNSNPNSGKIAYITNKDILTSFFKICSVVNKETKWDLDIDSIQPLIYREYNSNYKSDWHVDQNHKLYEENNIRKISFTIFLNNDFKGGEFDLDQIGPHEKKLTQTFDHNVPVNTALFYQSFNWYRIKPIFSGIRKTISGFILGPKYK